MSSRDPNSLMHDIDHAEPTRKAKKESSGVPGVPPWAQALVIVAALAVGGGLIWALSGDGNIQEIESRQRVVVDLETGELFPDFRIREGLTVPYTNPKTGTATLVPAEACYWTADGKAKLEPHYVVLNEYRGEPGPTICPVCGREVRRFNPMPPIELMLEAAEAAEG